jgi:hypothetical protein
LARQIFLGGRFTWIVCVEQQLAAFGDWVATLWSNEFRNPEILKSHPAVPRDESSVGNCQRCQARHRKSIVIVFQIELFIKDIYT